MAATHRRVVVGRRGGPDVLRIVEEPVPQPRPGEVRVKVRAAGVAFADVLMREGMYPGTPKPPFTPGYDIAGIVDADGGGWKKGQGVVALTRIGGYAEYACVPEAALVAAPPELDPAATVSLVLNYLTAYQMLHRMARVAAGERILVHGAGGGVGTALLELGRLAELEMLGTASRGKHALVESLGGKPIDYKTTDFVTRVGELLPGGVDAVFDAVGGRQWRRSYAVLRGGGRLIGYGFSAATSGGRRDLLKGAGALAATPRFSPLGMMDVNRMVGGYNVDRLRMQRPEWYRADLAMLVGMLAAGQIKPVVHARLPLAEATRAHEMLGSAEGAGKIVLVTDAD
ncbi:MAG TPA: medium chain dehydrogenase/reductase family protein [Candidatus Binatia bacterium]